MADRAGAALPLAEIDYDLPRDRIAQTPLAERDASRLLHLSPGGGLEDHRFTSLPALLSPGDLLVVNDTRVRAARLRGTRPDGGAAEVLVLAPQSDGRFRCLVRPSRRLPPGTEVRIDAGLTACIGEPLAGHPGERAVRLDAAGGDVGAAIEAAGSVPLPPYIRGGLADPGRYQTVFSQASPPESAAAPTAGLHFTPAVLRALEDRGVERCTVRLEVGLGTFAPIRTADAADHVVHAERFELPGDAAEAIGRTRSRGGRVVAVGSTSVRVLETMARPGGLVAAGEGTTDLYLRPGTPPRVVDGLLTNFHQPRSSLLVLVAALVGRARWREAYDHALRRGYRFLSFGDCMLCWRDPAAGADG